MDAAPFRKNLTILLPLVLTAMSLGQAETTPAPAATTDDLPPDVAAQVAQLWQPWKFSGEVRSEAGYDDNIYLSPGEALGGAFVRGELEAYLLRLPSPTDPFTGFAYVNGNYTDFLSGGTRPDEQEWYAGVQTSWQPLSALQFSVNGQGYFQDEVFDLSASAAEHLVARMRVIGGKAFARARWDFWRSFWLEGEAQQQRSHFQGFDEDYDYRGGAARLGWTRPDRAEISFTYTEGRRDYFERTQYTAFGRVLASPLLSFIQRDGELKTEFDFALAGQWTVTTTLGYLANRDNGSGFFNYDEKSALEQIAWENGPWRIVLSGSAQRYVFALQVVGSGLNPTPRLIEDYDNSARFERKLGRHWKLFTEDRWERSRSNDLASSYEVNTTLAGVGFSF